MSGALHRRERAKLVPVPVLHISVFVVVSAVSVFVVVVVVSAVSVSVFVVVTQSFSPARHRTAPRVDFTTLASIAVGLLDDDGWEN